MDLQLVNKRALVTDSAALLSLIRIDHSQGERP
jgi:hypothetical protein